MTSIGIGLALGQGSRAAAQAASALTGVEWSAEEVLGQTVPDGAAVTLLLDGQGRAAGRSGCNRFTGGVEIGSGTMRFGQMAGTRMACPEPLMELEQRVLSALQGTRLFTMDGSRSKLRLLDEGGTTVMVLTR